MKFKVISLFSLTFLLFQIAFGQDGSSNMPIKPNYKLAPGDEVTTKVLGEDQFNFVGTVNGDGTLEVPFFDKPVMASCKTEAEVRSEIKKLIEKYIKNPNVALSVKSNSRADVSVSGEVNSPKPFTLLRDVTLLELINASGGVKEDTAGGMIQVVRTQPPMCTNDPSLDWRSGAVDKNDVPTRLYSYSNLKQGKEGSNPIIIPGDIIIVLKAKPVYVTGQVMNPGGLYMRETGLSLKEAIAQASGVSREAQKKDVRIYRQQANSNKYGDKPIVANLELIDKGLEKDVMLEPYDVIDVGEKKDSTAMAILKGALGLGRTFAGSTSTSFGQRMVIR